MPVPLLKLPVDNSVTFTMILLDFVDKLLKILVPLFNRQIILQSELPKINIPDYQTKDNTVFIALSVRYLLTFVVKIKKRRPQKVSPYSNELQIITINLEWMVR